MIYLTDDCEARMDCVITEAGVCIRGEHRGPWALYIDVDIRTFSPAVKFLKAVHSYAYSLVETHCVGMLFEVMKCTELRRVLVIERKPYLPVL